MPTPEKYAAMTDEQREAYKARGRAYWANLSPEQRKEQNKRLVDRRRAARAAMTPEENEAYLSKKRTDEKARRAAMSPEQLERLKSYGLRWKERNPEKHRDAVREGGIRYRNRMKTADPETLRLRGRKGQLWTKFRLTLEQYDSLVSRQNGRCAVCDQPETTMQRGRVVPLSVDHDRSCCPGDRSCGDCVRGLLCVRCNMLLGGAKDSPETLSRAIAYLTERRESKPV